ncbi:DUF6622 family protein [Undibacterium sp. Di24W]|uniref:DUF6622 family protein n=1 Tax=Undibacterium sp. Di24W TaxID=3413033 RepID=UPI003BF14C5B
MTTSMIPAFVSSLVSHTPGWVWLLLTGLCVLGFSQTRSRQLSLQRLCILPLVMLGLSLSGMASSLGLSSAVLFVWGSALVISAIGLLGIGVGRGIRYEKESKLFRVPGSWLPLLLILTMFVAKYSVSAGLAILPALAQQAAFTLSFSAIFGVLNGAFLVRALVVLRLLKSEQSTLNLAV